MFRSLLVTGILALFATTASAHHNWAAFFDVQGDVEFEGVISSITWKNPHVGITFTSDPGTPNEKEWWTSSNSVAALTRMGITQELLAVGTQVRVAGYPSRASEDGVFMNHMLLPNSQEIVFLRTAEPRWPEADRIGNTDIAHGRVTEDDFSKRPTSVFAVWSTIFGAEGSHQALNRDPIQWTERGAEIAAENALKPVDASCTTKGMPGVMGAPYPVQIIDQGDIVVIHAEEYDSIRQVQMNTPHEDPGTADNLGYSTGRMVGDTLTVTTTFGSESGMQIHETFHLSDDHHRLLYSQTVVDPEMRLMPTVNKKWWQYVPGSFVQPYECTY